MNTHPTTKPEILAAALHRAGIKPTFGTLDKLSSIWENALIHVPRAEAKPDYHGKMNTKLTKDPAKWSRADIQNVIAYIAHELTK